MSGNLHLPGGPGLNQGHGHVFERPDRTRARCGGPSLCKACAADLARKQLADSPPVPEPGVPLREARCGYVDCDDPIGVGVMVDTYPGGGDLDARPLRRVLYLCAEHGAPWAEVTPALPAVKGQGSSDTRPARPGR